MFVAVFIVAFMTSDYVITGSVTETWMGIAVVAGILIGILRRMVSAIAGAVTS